MLFRSHLERELKKSYTGNIPKPKTVIHLKVTGATGRPLSVESNGIRVHSAMPLQTAFKRPLTEKVLRDQLGRMGETDYELGDLDNQLIGQVILPVSELNRLRREITTALAQNPPPAPPRRGAPASFSPPPEGPGVGSPGKPELSVLCRTLDQIRVALAEGIAAIYVDFEDLRRYPDAVKLVREHPGAHVFLATPRIQKAGEQGFFRLIENAQPDGVLIRNLGGLAFFRESPLRKIGDFSLNVANPRAAALLMEEKLERVTVSYDLNGQQVLDLLAAAPPAWFELVIHQHLPMFHMEHCVFAAFLTTTGTDHTNCGRPCDVHNLKLRDRIGVEHPVKADVGCRNTVYHAKAQSGAEFLQKFLAAGARHYRVELLEEDAERSRQLLQAYRQMLAGGSADLLAPLNVVRQLGVTSGTLTVLG